MRSLRKAGVRFASSAILAALSLSFAMAADLPSRKSPAPVPYERPAGFNWNGFYFGGFAGGLSGFGGRPGWGRLFNAGHADQLMWLLPVALAGLAIGVVVAVRQRVRDARLGLTIAFGGWLTTGFVLFSLTTGIYHDYYVDLLAPPLAGLVGVAVGSALAARHRRLVAIVSAAVISATAVLQVAIVARSHHYQAMRWIIPILLGCAVVLLFVDRRNVSTSRVLVASFAVALIAPAVWSVSGVRHAIDGTFPAARPGAQGADCE